MPELAESFYRTIINSIIFNPPEVEEILKIIKTGKASGPDDLGNHNLKELSNEICSLFNNSLSLWNFPLLYKDANVSPVPMKGIYHLLPITGLYPC